MTIDHGIGILIQGHLSLVSVATYPAFGLNMSPNEDPAAVADCWGCDGDCFDDTAEKDGAGMVDNNDVVVTGQAGPSCSLNGEDVGVRFFGKFICLTDLKKLL